MNFDNLFYPLEGDLPERARQVLLITINAWVNERDEAFEHGSVLPPLSLNAFFERANPHYGLWARAARRTLEAAFLGLVEEGLLKLVPPPASREKGERTDPTEPLPEDFITEAALKHRNLTLCHGYSVIPVE